MQQLRSRFAVGHIWEDALGLSFDADAVPGLLALDASLTCVKVHQLSVCSIASSLRQTSSPRTCTRNS